jgi:hypothetical protein
MLACVYLLGVNIYRIMSVPEMANHLLLSSVVAERVRVGRQ